MADGFLYFDISPEISERTAVFPGDRPFKRKVALDFSKGDHLTLSSIETTLHIGAHVDAPNHYSAQGESMGSRSLEYYLGHCQVIEVSLARGERIYSKHFSGVEIGSRRVLFKTGSFPDPNSWNGDFNSLSAELVEYLAARGVILAGIDTPSVDLAEDKILESHQAIERAGMAVLEGIILKDVAPGFYSLISLPLRIRDADASPVRAILIPSGPSGDPGVLWKR